MKRSTRHGACAMAIFLVTFFGCGMVWAAPSPASLSPSGQHVDAPENSFLASDDYSDSDKIKGVFLKDAEYAKMTEDFSRNDADEFDWGWAAPGLDLHRYKTVHVIVKDDYGTLNPDFKKYVGEVFEAAAKHLGLRVVAASKSADLELGLDIVGYDADRHYAFVTMIEPSVELEIRIKDLKSGNDLLLVRNNEHGHNPKVAASDTAHDFMQMLR